MPALNPIGKPFIELLSVESTNNYAMGLARAGMAQHGTAVFTHEQTKGRGQRQRNWISEKGKNIAMSIIVEPKMLQSSEIFLLSMMAAVGVRQLLGQVVNDKIDIKWPNDIYWRDRKAAGILIENIWQGNEWKFAVVGIGINVNQTEFRELDQRAVSLKIISAKELMPMDLAKELCDLLEEKFQLLTRLPEAIVADYKSHLYKRNQLVKLKKDNRLFEATIRDVTTAGALVVEHAVEESYNVGDVEWIVNGA